MRAKTVVTELPPCHATLLLFSFSLPSPILAYPTLLSFSLSNFSLCVYLTRGIDPFLLSLPRVPFLAYVTSTFFPPPGYVSGFFSAKTNVFPFPGGRRYDGRIPGTRRKFLPPPA